MSLQKYKRTSLLDKIEAKDKEVKAEVKSKPKPLKDKKK